MKNQLSKTATINLIDEIHKVFPLFSPLGEKKWVEGWNPVFIHPASGDWVENMVFKTTAGNTTERTYNWVLSHLDHEAHLAVYTVFTENRVWTIKVKCTALQENTSQAEITYTFTACNEKGYALNKEAIEKMYRFGMKDWEEAMNCFLRSK